MIGDEEILRAGFNPAGWPFQMFGNRGDDQLFMIDTELCAESTTYFRSDDTELRLGEAELWRGRIAPAVWTLGGDPDRQAAS